MPVIDGKALVLAFSALGAGIAMIGTPREPVLVRALLQERHQKQWPGSLMPRGYHKDFVIG